MEEEKTLSFARAFIGKEGLSTFTSKNPLQCTLYLNKIELVCLEETPYAGGYMVYINRPYWQNGEEGFVARKKETEKQHVFLETKSWQRAFNMVKRIAEQRRYPKIKLAW